MHYPAPVLRLMGVNTMSGKTTKSTMDTMDAMGGVDLAGDPIVSGEFVSWPELPVYR